MTKGSPPVRKLLAVFVNVWEKNKRYLLINRYLYIGWIHRNCDRVLLLSVFSVSRTIRPILLKLSLFYSIFLTLCEIDPRMVRAKGSFLM